MKIDDIVNAINNENPEGQTKEASDTSSKGALASVLSKIEEGSAKKEASDSDSDSDAVEALMKIASDLAGAEKEAEAAQAYLCGAAFADGAIAKFAAYDAAVKEAAANESVALLKEEKERLAKVAGTGTTEIPQAHTSNEAIYKQARAEVEQEFIAKQAAEAGYMDAISILKRAAEEEKEKKDKEDEEKKKKKSSKVPPQFLSNKKKSEKEDSSSCKEAATQEGYNAALQQVHDLAVNEFLKGAAAAEIMVSKYRENSAQQA